MTYSAVVLLATFTNADTVAGTVPNADTGQAFTQIADAGIPSWRIVSNQVSHAASLATGSLLSVDSGISDGVFSVKLMSLGAGNTAGLMIRAASALSTTHIRLDCVVNGFVLYKIVASSAIQLTGFIGHAFVPGDEMKIIAIGSQLIASVGATSVTVTETTGQTATFIGLRTDNAVTLDDLTASGFEVAVDSGSNSVGFSYGAGVIRGKTALLSDGGGAVAGSGTGSIAMLGSLPSNLAAANVTGEALVKIPAGNVSGAFVKFGGKSSGWGFGVGNTSFDDAGKKLILINETIRWHVTAYSFGTGVYHVVVVRGDSGAFTCYVNGSSVATGTMSSPIVAAVAIGVGGYGDSVTRPLSATVDVDNVAMYASALSSARVAAHYNGGAVDNAAITADSPVVWLKLDDGAAATAALPLTVGMSASASTIAKSTVALALAIGMTAVASTVAITSASFPIGVGMSAVGSVVSLIPSTTADFPVTVGLGTAASTIASTTSSFPLAVGMSAAASTIASTTAQFPITAGFGAVGSIVSTGPTTTAAFPISVGFESVGFVCPTTTAAFSISVGFDASAVSYVYSDLVGYAGENNDIQITIELTGRLDPILPPPVPPVDFAGIADPTVAPTLTKSDTDGGHLLVGTYRYSYAGWKGSEGQATAPSPTADITLVAEDTVTLTFPTIANADGYLVYREEV